MSRPGLFGQCVYACFIMCIILSARGIKLTYNYMSDNFSNLFSFTLVVIGVKVIDIPKATFSIMKIFRKKICY